ncbi:MAG: HAMP domain-containing sensor histidine kinase [Polyangiaceae bacterium]
MLSIALLLSVRGLVQVRDQSRAFDADMLRDHRFVGRGLAADAAEVWRSDSSARAQHLVDVAGHNAEADIKLSWLTERNLGHGLAPNAALRRALQGHEVQQFDAGYLRSYFPLRVDSSVAALLVSEPLVERDRHSRRYLVHVAVNLAVVLSCCGGLAMLLSRWIVATPVNLLIEKARRVGRGDFSSPLSLRRVDEFQRLAVEMNAMCDALARAKGEVASEVRARQVAIDQLRHADRLSTVGKLAAGVAHELGTPLSIVSGHAEMIANGEVQGPKIIDSATIIARESRRIAGIVRSLLGFARRKGPEGGSCDAVEVIRRCIALLQPMAQKANLVFGLQASDDCRATIDQDSLQQVMTNLLSNAIQAMESAGTIELTVWVETAQPPQLGAHRQAFVRVDVADTGPGMSAEVLPHIFEPFFSTKAPSEGSGLGLSVVHGIVLDHGGFLSVKSTPGKGSCFSVFLPSVE